ncbi:hypothetical protein HZ326_30656 [Fusarium oxysporum f. sp. albedinis]|nr:hypothetical protein HZ326_30656 [Fusarium oxysporum f. sp. albedinis]
MHQIALFKSEVQILREENETLSRRRHVKKKRLRQGGSLMLRQGQDLQGQNDVDVQLHEESRELHHNKFESIDDDLVHFAG